MKSYGGLRAVSDVSFSARRGECLALLGPNGAGKSTTLNLLAGVLRPDAGTISVAGLVDPTRANVRRQVGFVPQHLAVYPELTAEENLRLFAKLYGVARTRVAERVEFGLNLAGLGEQRRKRVGAFSGGMQRRLNLACSLLHEPTLLLLDEPTVGVDPQSRSHLFDCIETLRASGLTLVYSTHYLEEAERLCDQVAILDRGRLLAAGPKSQLAAGKSTKYWVEAELLEPAGTRSHVAFACDAPEDALERLGQTGATLLSLNIRQPNLEAVFLALTGKRLRD